MPHIQFLTQQTGPLVIMPMSGAATVMRIRKARTLA